MAEAILKFDLNDPDDTMAHLRAIKSLDMALVLWEILYNSKKGFQYDIEARKYEDQYELLDAVYSKMWEEMNDRGINLDDLIN
jgi:hypothetical protein